MTCTRSSSPGRNAGFMALASELTLRTRMPCGSATRLRLKSVVRIAPRAALASATSFPSTSVTPGTSASVTSTGTGPFWSEDRISRPRRPRGEHPAPPGAAQPPVDDGAGVDEDALPTSAALAARSGEEPQRLRCGQQIVPLGDRRAEHAQPEHDRHADGEEAPEGLLEGRERQTEQETHEEADEEAA